MIDHAEARMLTSARSDGELEAARFAELDEHLGSCEACRAFSSALPQLSVLTAALPREHAPAELTRRVGAGIAPGRSRVRSAWRPRRRVAPALAAALVVAIVAVMIGTVPVVRVPSADAARALSRLRSLYVEREITSYTSGGDVDAVTRERIWFKAPSLVRTETTARGASVLTIEGPGFRYREDANGRFLNTNLLPSLTPLPEPLTPTLTLLGVDSGIGPTVLGRPTRRITLRFENEQREALVDAETFAVVGVSESTVVFRKDELQEGRLRGTKRTLALEYNPVLDDALFDIPEDATVIENDAVPLPLGSVSAPPAGRLEGLELVAAATENGSEAVLYARGAFRVLLEIDGPIAPPSLARSQPALVGTRMGTLFLPLYGLPEIRFTVDGHRIAIRAPLAPPLIQELALRMYPERE